MDFPVYENILKGRILPKFRKANLKDKLSFCYSILDSCNLCERKCGTKRLEEKGYCKVRASMKIFGADTHMGEESEIIPSATIFFSGCTLRCLYCQNAPESLEPEKGFEWNEEAAAKWIEKKFEEGCKNVNFVGGEPTPYIYNIIKTLSMCKRNIPVIYNSNGYYSEIAGEVLNDIVDLYLLDLKYFSNDCAKRLSDADNYTKVLARNILKANQAGEILIRMLILPGHIECCAKRGLEWIKSNLGNNANINIMGQYRPCFNATIAKELRKPLKPSEYKEVLNHAEKIGLRNFTYQSQFLN